jgi:glycopeptide antibiotics resistance protein
MSNLSVLVFLLTYIAFLILATLGKAEMLIADPDQIRIRIEQFFSIPLSRYYLKTEFTAFNLLFSKLIVFVPIGFLLGKIINGSKWADRIWFVLLSCGALGVMLEFLQVFAPPLIPDVWDAVFYALGGVVGFHFLQTILMSSNTGQGVGKS